MKKKTVLGMAVASALCVSSAMAAGTPSVDYSAEIVQKVIQAQKELSPRTRSLLAEVLLHPSEENLYCYMTAVKKDHEAKETARQELSKPSLAYRVEAKDGIFLGDQIKNSAQLIKLAPPSLKNGNGGIDFDADSALIYQLTNLMKNDRFYAYALALRATNPTVYQTLIDDESLRLAIDQNLAREKQISLLKKIENNQERLIHLLSPVTSHVKGEY